MDKELTDHLVEVQGRLRSGVLKARGLLMSLQKVDPTLAGSHASGLMLYLALCKMGGLSSGDAITLVQLCWDRIDVSLTDDNLYRVAPSRELDQEQSDG